MRPERFEEIIKEQLTQRKIEPSSGAWKNIEQQLDASPGKSSRKNYAVWFAAAGFVGILILAGSFFAKNEKATTPQLVEQDPEERTQTINPADSKVQESLAVIFDEVSKDDKTTEKQQTAKPVIRKSKLVFQETVTVAEVTKEPEEKDAAADVTYNVDKSITSEVEALLSEVKDQESQGGTVSDEEIEKLLRRAQRDIVAGALLKNEGSVVNASDLLFEVESELDHSFRERVFETLKEKFIKARAAFAARN